MQDLTTFVLAGDRGPNDPVARAGGVTRKVLAPIAGKPMICHVLESLIEAQPGTRILVIANNCRDIEQALRPYAASFSSPVEFVEGAGSPAVSVLEAAKARDTYPLLIVTGDHPLLSAAAIKEFLTAASKQDADVFAALTARSTVVRAFPKCSRTFIRLGKESYSGANLFLIKTRQGLKVVEFWTKLEKSRKKALKIVSAFGWGNLFRVLLRLTDVDRAMDRISGTVGVGVRAVVLKDPASAMDVDKEEHLKLARSLLEKEA